MRIASPLRLRLLALAVLLCCCHWTVTHAGGQTSVKGTGPVVVTLRASTVVEEPVVTVGAIATIEGGGPALRQRIAALDVAEVSEVGRTVVVSREQLGYRLRIAGIDGDAFRVEGPGQVQVKMMTAELTEEAVARVAERAILQHVHAASEDAEFRVVERVVLPALNLSQQDHVRLSVDPLPRAPAPGRVRVEVAVHVNGQRCVAVPVTLELMLYKQAAVTLRRLEPGEMLQAADIRLERRLFHPGDAWLPFGEQLLGKRLVHSVMAGQALAPADLDLPVSQDEVLIRAHDYVKLLATLGTVSVIATGEALQDGKAGQVIRVRNIDSGKVVTGRVAGRSTVEVEY